jgi:uncharacterized protein YkwD
MKRKITFALMLLMAGIMFISSCKKDEDDNNDDNTPTVDPERQAVLDDYNNLYLTSSVSDCGWTGTTSSCTAGTMSADAIAKTLQRINYFRKEVGLNTDITFDAAKNAKCQEAALMMDANNDLNHYPPSTWTCYTADGATAAGNSNLALGSHSSSAISLYMQDPGSGNTACGHRRWILYSRSKIMGIGSTSSANSLWVLGNSGNPLPTSMPEFISWPPKGYVCAPLVFTRWSLSVPSADFSAATVSMTDGSGTAVPCTIVSSTDDGYGDNTIVWEPTGINTSNTSDITYHVNVNNVTVSSSAKNYSYDVVIIQP